MTEEENELDNFDYGTEEEEFEQIDLFEDVDDEDDISAEFVSKPKEGSKEPEKETPKGEEEEEEEFEKGETSKEEDISEEDALIIENDTDLLLALLKTKGIDNHEEIQYEDEDGNIQKVNFYDLPAEDRLNILNSSDADINYGLTDDEIETVNFLRKNSANLNDLIEYTKKQAVEEYIKTNTPQDVGIDSINDQELFVLDLKSKFDDLTEEEIQFELEKQLENEDLFKKKVNKIRAEYKEIEAEKLESDRLSEQSEQDESFERLASSIVEVAENTEDIGGLDLSIDDKNEVLDYILNKDINGVTNFVKNLDNHDTLFKMAWFALKGNEAFDVLHDYYKKQIDNVRKTSGKKPNTPTKKSGIVVKDKPKQTNNADFNGESIDDLYN